MCTLPAGGDNVGDDRVQIAHEEEQKVDELLHNTSVAGVGQSAAISQGIN